MATAFPSAVIKQRFFDSNGKPLAFGKLHSYVAGSAGAINQDTYGSASLLDVNPNPVILDAFGYADIWTHDDEDYLFVLRDANDALIWTVDDIPGGTKLTSSLNAAIASVYANLASTATDKGPSLIGFIQPFVDALTRDVKDYLYDRVSIMDYIPIALHASIRDRTISDTQDLGPYFNKANAALPYGKALYIPDGLYPVLTPIVWSRGIPIYGDPGKHDSDNSWYQGGGTEINWNAQSGDCWTASPANVGNNRMSVVMRDVYIRGNRNVAGATGGRGLVVDGRNQPATNCHIDFYGVHVADAYAEGITLVKTVYGGIMTFCSATDCGANGLKLEPAGGQGITEVILVQCRFFANGSTATLNSRAGVWAIPGFNIYFIACSFSENAGPGIIAQAGSFVMLASQLESNLGAAQIQMGSGGGGAGVTYCRAIGTNIAPGSGYTGVMILITSDAFNCSFEGIAFNDTLGVGGLDFSVDGPRASFKGFSVNHVLAYIARPDTFVENSIAGKNANNPLVKANRGTTTGGVTGNGGNYQVVFDVEARDRASAYNNASGLWTCPADGDYRFTWQVTFDALTSSMLDGVVAVVTGGTGADPGEGTRFNPWASKTGTGNFSTVAGSSVLSFKQGNTAYINAIITGGASDAARVVGGGLYTRLAIEAVG